MAQPGDRRIGRHPGKRPASCAIHDRANAQLTREVEERKRAEYGLQGLHQRLSDILEFLPDSVLVIDERRKVIIWNRALEKMTGVSQAEMLEQGRNYEYAVPFYGENRPILCDLIEQPDEAIESRYDFFAREHDTLYAEAFFPDMNQKKGGWFWKKASPLYDQNGRISGAIQSIRDVTRHKLADLPAGNMIRQNKMQL